MTLCLNRVAQKEVEHGFRKWFSSVVLFFSCKLRSRNLERTKCQFLQEIRSSFLCASSVARPLSTRDAKITTLSSLLA